MRSDLLQSLDCRVGEFEAGCHDDLDEGCEGYCDGGRDGSCDGGCDVEEDCFDDENGFAGNCVGICVGRVGRSRS